MPDALLLVVVDNRASLRVEDLETLAERLDIVVCPLDQRLTSDVVDVGLFRWADGEYVRSCFF